MAETQKAEALENTVNPEKKGLRKLTKTKEEREAERAALSELEPANYVPEKHAASYDVAVDRKQYRSNYAMAVVLVLIGGILFKYSWVATVLLVFYGAGVAWTAYKSLKLFIHVDGTRFSLKGTKYAGNYTFSQVEKIIYSYNKKEQRRYWVYVDGNRICEISPGAINGRFLYDDMIAYGVPGGLYQKL